MNLDLTVLARMAARGDPGLLLYCFPRAGITKTLPHPGFYGGAVDLHSGLHFCVANVP